MFPHGNSSYGAKDETHAKCHSAVSLYKQNEIKKIIADQMVLLPTSFHTHTDTDTHMPCMVTHFLW